MARKTTRLIWTTLCLVMWCLTMSASVRAAQVSWSINQFSFAAANGGGNANGKFVFDASTLQVVSWTIAVDAAVGNQSGADITALTYQSGLVGHTADISSTGTI